MCRYLRSLLPNNQPVLRTLVTQRATYPVQEDEFLEREIESALSKLINAYKFYKIIQKSCQKSCLFIFFFLNQKYN